MNEPKPYKVNMSKNQEKVEKVKRKEEIIVAKVPGQDSKPKAGERFEFVQEVSPNENLKQGKQKNDCFNWGDDIPPPQKVQNETTNMFGSFNPVGGNQQSPKDVDMGFAAFNTAPNNQNTNKDDIFSVFGEINSPAKPSDQNVSSKQFSGFGDFNTVQGNMTQGNLNSQFGEFGDFNYQPEAKTKPSNSGLFDDLGDDNNKNSIKKNETSNSFWDAPQQPPIKTQTNFDQFKNFRTSIKPVDAEKQINQFEWDTDPSSSQTNKDFFQSSPVKKTQNLD